jgi:hypothetical protein
MNPTVARGRAWTAGIQGIRNESDLPVAARKAVR